MNSTHTTSCPECNSEIDISHEKTLFLRELLDHGSIHLDNYHHLIDELNLPDPGRQSQEKAEKLLQQITGMKKQIRETTYQEERKELEAKLNQLEQEFQIAIRTS